VNGKNLFSIYIIIIMSLLQKQIEVETSPFKAQSVSEEEGF